MSLQSNPGLAWFGDPSAGWLAVLLVNAVKSALVLAGAALMAYALKRASAAARHLVWFIPMASLPLLPLISRLVPPWEIMGPFAKPAIPAAIESLKHGNLSAPHTRARIDP